MKHIVYGLIIAFLLIFILKSECGKPKGQGEIVKVDGKKYEVLKHTIDTQYVPVKIKGTRDTIVEDTTIYVEVPVMDSTELRKYVEEYYAKKVYNDTIKLEYGKIFIHDTISTNKIINRAFAADLLIPTITDTKIVKELPKNQIYLGVRGDVTQGYSLFGVGPQIMLKTKKNKIYGVGMMMTQDKPIYSVNFAFKL
jgi:hypothetical protein